MSGRLCVLWAGVVVLGACSSPKGSSPTGKPSPGDGADAVEADAEGPEGSVDAGAVLGGDATAADAGPPVVYTAKFGACTKVVGVRPYCLVRDDYDFDGTGPHLVVDTEEKWAYTKFRKFCQAYAADADSFDFSKERLELIGAQWDCFPQHGLIFDWFADCVLLAGPKPKTMSVAFADEWCCARNENPEISTMELEQYLRVPRSASKIAQKSNTPHFFDSAPLPPECTDWLGPWKDPSYQGGPKPPEKVPSPCDPPDPKPSPEICDGVDNDCDGQTDEGFKDTDENGQADCVDPDLDGDTWSNEEDNCPTVPNPDQTDANHDSIGDACQS